MDSIVFSYQGAFGPPTYGHYKSMETFIKRITQDYGGDKTYTFLFMPTKKSSSKPHLEGTMKQREKILQKFCDKLSEKYPGVTVAPSRIEFDKDTPSDTINTIDVLKREYGNSKIILGMGKDNALQLPYWARIGEYKDNVERIYLVTREVGGVTTDFKDEYDNLIGTFDAKVPGWAAKDDRLEPVFGIYAKDLLEGNIIPDNTPIKIGLPKIEEISAVIPPSSSSMIRHFISRIIKDEEDKEVNKTKIKKLMFGNDFEDDEVSDEIVGSVIKDYKKLYEENENVKASLDSSYGNNEQYHEQHLKYDDEYDNYMNKISHSDGPEKKKRGGKSKRKKSMKKNRKSLKKKRKSKRRKSLKKKQRKTKRKGRK